MKKNEKMNSEKILLKNVERWAVEDPKNALLLPYTSDEHLIFTQTQKKELNLGYRTSKGVSYFHSSKGALKEAEKWFKQLNIDRIEVLYIYGVGLGYAYLAAKKWLKSKRRRVLIFIDDDLPVIRRLLQTELGSKILRDSQVRLRYFKTVEDGKEIFEELYWTAAQRDWSLSQRNVQVVASPLYSIKKKEIYDKLSHAITYETTLKNAFLAEYLDLGGGFFKNFYYNLLHLEGSYLGNRLFEKFKGVPAIICGAGPSLAKQIPKLAKIMDKSLVFAGGSALNALNAADFMPHFGAGIDPNAAQLDRLKTNRAFELPFFYRNRMYHPACMMIHGPRLYITGSGGYDISTWFEEQLGILGEWIEEGYNVVNFCLEIAHAMGCNPIIFVGMDLAYTDMKLYSEGVIEDNSIREKQAANPEEPIVVKKDIYGKPIHTLWKWIIEAGWISTFAKDHPDVKVLNATEGGLGFEGVENMPLKKVVDNYLKVSQDLPGRIHGEIQNAAMPQVTTRHIRELLEQLKNSLGRCIQGFEHLIEEGEAVKTKILEKQDATIPLQTGRSVLIESDLAEEVGYSFVLDIFNIVYARALNYELQCLTRPAKGKTAIRRLTRRIDLNAARLIFLCKVAQLNIVLIEEALQNNA